MKPAFPFGYGLSYTTFAIENLKVEQWEQGRCAVGDKNDIHVTTSADVTNTGTMAGAEVVQCYVTDCECSVERPVKELKAYRKVFLEPGETKKVTMELPERAFAFYDVERRAFRVEPGKFQLHVGNASDHCILQAEVEIGGENHAPI